MKEAGKHWLQLRHSQEEISWTDHITKWHYMSQTSLRQLISHHGNSGVASLAGEGGVPGYSCVVLGFHCACHSVLLEQSTSHCQTKHGKYLASSQAVPTFSLWLLTVCKHGGGNAWEIWSRALTSEERGQTHRGQCLTAIIPVSCRLPYLVLNNEWYWCCLANTLASSPWNW